MTTYKYRVTLNDREIGILQDALEHYRDHSEAPDEPCRPIKYIRPAAIVDRILSRLYLDTEMTSTNADLWPREQE